VTFIATGLAGIPTQIASTAGNSQSAAVGSAVAIAPSVLVKDASNNPVSGVSVTFAVASGGGVVTGSTVTTNATGIAAVGSWTLGTGVGVNTLTVTAAGLSGPPITFTATSVAGTATQIARIVGDSQSVFIGTSVVIPPSVLVTDAYRNPVNGVPVIFAVASGGGLITGGSVTTNASGIATVGSWTLGAAAGSNTLTATATGLTGARITFSATGITSSAKDLLAFAFPKSATGAVVDGEVAIAGRTVSAFLPAGTNLRSIKPTFVVSPGASVTVNGAAQTSGTSAVDFTSPVNYVVRAVDGTIATYTVGVTSDIPTIDAVMTAFMGKYGVPGLSLAITKDENLVYVKAYGKADATQALTTSNLFRIASLSKSITSAAIMRLVDQGKLSLGQKVFGATAVLGTTYGAQPFSAWLTDITVDQLLHHTAGGWPNDAQDPMFTNPAMTVGQLISWTLDNRPLSNVPGSTYAYSNFGYSVLGRVIEKVTGQSYVDAVNSLVLAPSGITTMRIAGNTLADRLPSEVQYTGQGENPYIYNVSRMDSHGGWIASATDLAKFLVRIDGQSGKTDILSPNALTTMTTGSRANPGYASGWLVNGPNWWNVGALPGTGTEFARTTSLGRYNFVILTNTRGTTSNYLDDLDQLFWSALAATSRLPSYDLFVGFP